MDSALIASVVSAVLSGLVALAMGLWTWHMTHTAAAVKRHLRRGMGVLVCGASAGIGEELTYIYARAGARLVLVARRADVLAQVAQRARDLGAAAVHTVAADLRGEAACQSVVAEAARLLRGEGKGEGEGEGEGLDVLALMHFWPFYARLHDKPAHFARIEEAFQVGAFSYFYLALHALPLLKRRRGNVIVCSSGAGRFATPFCSVYCAYKHAIHGFFNSLRLDIAPEMDVAITVVALGRFDTEPTRRTLKGALSHLAAGKPADAAHALVEAAARRLKDVAYPWDIDLMYKLSVLWPGLAERILVYVTRGAETKAPE